MCICGAFGLSTMILFRRDQREYVHSLTVLEATEDSSKDLQLWTDYCNVTLYLI